MTIIPTDPSDETDSALAGIDRAIRQFEQIILKRLSKSGRRSNAARTGVTVAGSLIDLLSGSGTQGRSSDFIPNPGRNNRFPVSSGQIFADLAGFLRGIGGRNL